MDEKELKKISSDILFLFDSVDERIPYGDDQGSALSSFIYEMAEAEYVLHLTQNKKLRYDFEAAEKVDDVMSDLTAIAFTFGFAIGQMFETPLPDAQNDIDAIKKVIREKALLPYLPRKERREP